MPDDNDDLPARVARLERELAAMREAFRDHERRLRLEAGSYDEATGSAVAGLVADALGDASARGK